MARVREEARTAPELRSLLVVRCSGRAGPVRDRARVLPAGCPGAPCSPSPS
ncbi:hypothetical protein ACIRPN_15815 [Streptomyces sp. NPDC101230]|uniref:hypothetical protein n=1 Tax=Streptomyces sp. NPDC101230 TaxID=3366137 RepID=UPI003802574E